MSENNKISENEKLIRKAPKNRSRSRKNRDLVKDGSNPQETDFESPRSKPPIGVPTKQSSRVNSNQNLRSEEKPRLRSRSRSKDREINGKGNSISFYKLKKNIFDTLN